MRPSIALTLAAVVATFGCAGESAQVGPCSPGARICAGDEVLECRADGGGYATVESCGTAFTCREGACVPRGADAAGDAVGPPARTDARSDALPETRGDAGPEPVADVAGRDTAADSGRDAREDAGPRPDVPLDGPDAAGPDAARPEVAGPDTAPDVPVPPLCGNGVRDPGELCDPEAPEGTPGVCPTACEPGAGCIARRLEGSALDCSAHCLTYTVTEAGPADDCCPTGATHETDPDCPITCGDGTIQDGERCDPGIAAPAQGSCPTSCGAPVGCGRFALEGSAAECSAYCRLVTITEVGPADGCCPTGATHESDPDCPVTCGDGTLQTGETCDPGIAADVLGACPTACPAAEPCRRWTLTGSAAACTATCAEEVVTTAGPADGCCPEGGTPEDDPDCVPVCGNGRVEAGEDCDGGAPAGVTCQSLGFATAGLPGCSGDCDLDTFPCGGHALVYSKITAIPPVAAARGSYRDVAWFPDGTAAVVATEDGALLRYDEAARTVSVLAGELVDSVGRLATVSSDGAVLVLGYDVGSNPARTGRAYLLTDSGAADGAPAPLPTLSFAGVALVAFAPSPDGSEAVVGGYDGTNHITHLYHVETGGWSVLAHGAFASFDGLSDVTWAHVPEGDPRFVLTFEGPTGADSHSWYLDFGEGPQSNGWSPGMGNAGRGGWRPGGRYALAAATTSEKLYVFSYQDAVSWDWWDAGNIPGYTTDFRGVYWHPRGHRALATGRPTGTPRAGRIVEVIPRGRDFDDDVDLRLADIVGYTEPPFNAGSSAGLNAAAWRPGPCEEGLLAGDDDGTSGAFGLLLRFVDEDDEDCEP